MWFTALVVGCVVLFVVLVCAFFAWFGCTLEKVMREEG
jgi:hypothetical protein